MLSSPNKIMLMPDACLGHVGCICCPAHEVGSGHAGQGLHSVLEGGAERLVRGACAQVPSPRSPGPEAGRTRPTLLQGNELLQKGRLAGVRSVRAARPPRRGAG